LLRLFSGTAKKWGKKKVEIPQKTKGKYTKISFASSRRGAPDQENICLTPAQKQQQIATGSVNV
jgi:hypothetical protein